MFVGESLAFFIYLLARTNNPQEFRQRAQEALAQGKTIKINKWLLLVPAASDLITSTLQYVALNFLPVSVYQMMRGGTIATTLIYSILMFNLRPKKAQIVGSVMTLMGVGIVGASNLILGTDEQEEAESVLLQRCRVCRSSVACCWCFLSSLPASSSPLRRSC